MSGTTTGKLPGFPLLLAAIFLVSTCIKILLIPAYRSTDFEVHRNWLAITHSLPLSQWYYEDTSPWTLDYPPLFAWFEWLLSFPAAAIDPLMVNIRSLNYASSTCIHYQRFTVILSDSTLLYAIFQYWKYKSHDKSHDGASVRATRASLSVSALLLLNYGLIVVDHIHFQYNGFLFGILLLSVVRIEQGRHVEGAFWFAVLLNLKHIFLYLAPAYFIHLLKYHCFQRSHSPGSPSLRRFLPLNFLKLGGVVAGVFLVSFGPFLALGQLGQVLSRLFPFRRGLCHAYWAPNAWALYSFMDMLVFPVGQRLGMWRGSCDTEQGSCGSMTSGLVGEMVFKALPNVPPLVTLLVTCASILPSLVKVWFGPGKCRSGSFLKILVLCAYSSFLFGWHVHEKAVLLITIPMSLLAVEEKEFARVFVFLSSIAHVSLFPLLHQPAETLLKLCLFIMCTCMTLLTLGPWLSLPCAERSEEQSEEPETTVEDKTAALSRQKQSKEKSSSSSSPDPPLPLSGPQALYLALVLLVQLYCQFLHTHGPLSRVQFLPLLLTSVTCAVAVLWTWAHTLILYYSNDFLRKKIN